MTLVPDLNKMAKFSICAQISNLIAFLVVFWFDFEHLHLFQAIKDRDEINVAGLAGFFSVAIYCYEVRFLLLLLFSWAKFINFGHSDTGGKICLPQAVKNGLPKPSAKTRFFQPSA